jgi:hypothetical protein
MEIGNPGEAIRGPSPIAGAAGTGLNNARSGSEESKSNPSSPSAAQTPNEALSYIDQLYKTGRMEDLAAILRRSEVFREAWLILQRSFTTPSAPSGERGLADLGEASEPMRFSAAAPPPAFVDIPNPARRLPYPFAKALEIYQSQLDYYDQEGNSRFRLSIRV